MNAWHLLLVLVPHQRVHEQVYHRLGHVRTPCSAFSEKRNLWFVNECVSSGRAVDQIRGTQYDPFEVIDALSYEICGVFVV